MNRKKRTLIKIFVLLCLLIGLPLLAIYDAMNHQRKNQALIVAVKALDYPKMRTLLREGAYGEAREDEKPPTLQEALSHFLDRFRHSGVSNPALNKQHPPALLLLYRTAIARNQVPGIQYCPYPDLSIVRMLLDQGANVNDQDVNGKSPLHYAACCSRSDVVRLLLERGADLEAKDTKGRTPLMAADAENVEILLEHGANIEARDGNKQTPLLVAIESQSADKARTLLEHGASVLAKDAMSISALRFCHDRKITAMEDAVMARVDADTTSRASPMDRHRQQALDMAYKIADKSYADACKIEALLSKYGAK